MYIGKLEMKCCLKLAAREGMKWRRWSSAGSACHLDKLYLRAYSICCSEAPVGMTSLSYLVEAMHDSH